MFCGITCDVTRKLATTLPMITNRSVLGREANRV
jgi:hypothetical protein